MKKKNVAIAITGIVVGIAITIGANTVYVKSSSNDSCNSCHFHPESTDTWKRSMHNMNESGVTTDCAACHLPPKGSVKYFKAKVSTGIKDVWSSVFKDKEDIDWDSKGDLEYATTIVYNESCKKCHTNLFPTGVTDDGITAHLYYEENEQKLNLQCISCHLNAGHFNPNYSHKKLERAPQITSTIIYDKAADVTEFKNFTETVPGTGASINMIAIPGGTFTIGSSNKEPFHKKNEEPQRSITISPFFMAEIETTWDQFWAFYEETMSEGRTAPADVYANNGRTDIEADAISGPTAPFGAPDQGWGMGSRPAITMTHYAAETFCQWLSAKTGRTYRLPTEAEWEYAARAGSDTPYFFEGNPKKLAKRDTTNINSYVVYAANSKNRTQEPSKVRANAFGLKNMLGNVLEYCSDWYADDAYSMLNDGAVDPKGPSSGTEHVVRGGLYNDGAAELRCASRRHTETDNWLRTDPQNPKSIWWYSDFKGIGFRVVCEIPENVDIK